MLRTTYIIALAVAIGIASPAFAQSPSSVDGQAARVQRLIGERAAWVEAKRGVNTQYRKQLANIDALKRRPSGWRRNRQLRAAYAETQQTAKRLANIDRRLRRYNQSIKSLRSRLLASIESELAGEPSPKRARYLRQLRRKQSSNKRQLARRIKLPSARIDPLASAEELEEQAKLLRQGERDLAKEIANLEQRETRLRRMAKLRRTARRTREMDLLDNNNPRRTTGRVSASKSEASSAGGDQADPAVPAPTDPGTSGEAPPPPDDGFDNSGGGTGGGQDRSDVGSIATDFSYVLADVVDNSTLSEYRSADRSGDPSRRADAARRLRRKTEQRLARLKRQRARMLEMAKKRRRR